MYDRHVGKPTILLTLSASEYKWVDLLRTLFTVKHDGRCNIKHSFYEGFFSLRLEQIGTLYCCSVRFTY